MYNKFYQYFRLFFFLLITTLLCFLPVTNILAANLGLMSIADYSYNKVYNALPEDNQDDSYIYESSDEVGLVTFATYNSFDYRTSIKHEKNQTRLLYCIDRNNSIEFTDQYILDKAFFNIELRTRLAIALYNGPQNWGDKANTTYTTGNSILDYYMTQLVIHALIYDYGGDKSNLGIDFSKVSFKENTGKLEKKTKALYNYCCNKELDYTNGYFQSVDFSFEKPSDNMLYLDDGYFVSSKVKYNVSEDVADVSNATFRIDGSFNISDASSVLVGKTSPFSSFSIKLPQEAYFEELSPGIRSIILEQTVEFKRSFAGLYICGEPSFTDTSQELGALLYDEYFDNDNVQFDILIGSVHLYKKDSVTGEPITDATFEILQYNSNTGEYEPHSTLSYNPSHQRYESKNLFLSINNKSGKFKIVETKAGANYILDWEGEEFTITNDCYLHDFYVENQPVLGSVQITKLGEQWSYTQDGFKMNNTIPLHKVSFSLYANEDIYVKGKVKYTKDSKIVDMYTDENGKIQVSDLPMGEYYIVEKATLDDYILDTEKHYFTITRDSKRKYSKASILLINNLKPSEIRIFKCYYDDADTESKNPLPLKNALFGLYVYKDLKDENGNIIVKKDTCVAKGYSDDNGEVVFKDLPHIEYYVKELKAPAGFVLNDGIQKFSLNDFSYDIAGKCYIANRKIINEYQRFSIQIDKTGEDFVGAQYKASDYGNYYEYTMGETTLQNVSFSLYDCKKTLLNTKKTDKNGKVQFDNLIPGTYYISETNTPEQYVIHPEYKEFVLEQDNKSYNIFNPTVFSDSFYNELCDCDIELTKLGEVASVTNKGLEYNNIPLKDVVFGIYQQFDYHFPDGNNVLSKGSCVGYIVTDSDGKGNYTGKLPCGEYYLKEVSTLPGYEISQERYIFTIEPNNNDVIDISVQETPIINKLSKASVKICKTDTDTGKPLKGVEFTLYNSDKQRIGVYKTNRKGVIIVHDLPYGEYYFVETGCPKGYYSSNNKYYFELLSDETIVLDITNSPIVKLGINEQYNFALISTLLVLAIFVVIIFTNVIFVYYNKKNNEDESC